MDEKRTLDYIHEPTDLQCGQAVLAMITGLTVEDVVQELENDRETTLKEMKGFLRSHGAWISDIRVQVASREELSDLVTQYLYLLSSDKITNFADDMTDPKAIRIQMPVSRHRKDHRSGRL